MTSTAIRPSQTQPGWAKASVTQEYLSFRLGAEEYGISILCIQEIRCYEASTRIAGAPPFISGVLNLRGEIVPVVDLRVQFDVPQRFDAKTVTVVLNLPGGTLGVVVDSVSDVLELSAENIRPAPAFRGAINGRHITGIAGVQQGKRQRTLVMLDIATLIADAGIGLTH
ncbi:chemotaxis protein CheW [Roseateles sp.]|uniref:chemotaxis protein CheW n=1 Tax=Roseateles sp. TaxID=1971397 RepID=UPI0039EB7BB9